ncbi:MAG: outer membrane beta-barrel protein [Phycisphaerales bacterium]|nr:outer membrane beta-barrel protein [Phycisphaerales bacterium]
MRHRHSKVSLALAALMATAGVAAAASPSAPTVSLDDSATQAQPQAMPQSQSLPALSYGLSKVPTGNGGNLYQDMQNWGINISGFIDAGYTANFDHQAGSNIGGRVFDQENGNHLQLDQIDVSISKAIDFSNANFRKRGWDVGGKVEVLYGMDGDLIHSNGMNFYHGNNYYQNGQNPFKPINQFDVVQAYATFAVPMFDTGGLKIKAGKFVTPFGDETINPTTNPFYSHSYEFGFGIPFTQTGILAIFSPNSDWTFSAGVTRGWNNTLTKTNDTLADFLGGINWTPQEKRFQGLTATLNYSLGAQDPSYYPNDLDGDLDGSGLRSGDNSHYRSVTEVILTYTPPKMSQLTLTSDSLWGYDGASDIIIPTGVSPGTGTVSYGPANYYAEEAVASYKLNSYVTLNGRAEWYHDGHSGTTYAIVGRTVNLSEFTIGATITPFPNSSWGKYLKLRPELRQDYADHPIFQTGGGSGSTAKRYQTTAAMDVIYSF